MKIYQCSRLLSKPLMTFCSVLILSACGGGGGGGGNASAGGGPRPSPADGPFISDVSKTGVWYGRSTHPGNAVAACEGCGTAQFSFRWVVDVNRDGIFDESANSLDVVQQGNQFQITPDTVSKEVKLIASNPQAKMDAFRIYTPYVDQVVSALEYQGGALVLNARGELEWESGRDNDPLEDEIERLSRELGAVHSLLTYNKINTIGVALSNSGRGVLFFDHGRAEIAGSVVQKLQGVMSIAYTGGFIYLFKRSGEPVVITTAGQEIDLEAARSGLTNHLMDAVGFDMLDQYSVVLERSGAIKILTQNEGQYEIISTEGLGLNNIQQFMVSNDRIITLNDQWRLQAYRIDTSVSVVNKIDFNVPENLLINIIQLHSIDLLYRDGSIARLNRKDSMIVDQKLDANVARITSHGVILRNGFFENPSDPRDPEDAEPERVGPVGYQ